MSFKKHLLKNVFWVYFFSYAVGGLGYLLRITYAHNLSVESYGLLYAVLGFLLLVSAFADLGIAETTNYFGTKYYEKKEFGKLKGLLFLSAGVQIIIATLLSVALYFGAKILGSVYFKVADASSIILILIPFFLALSILTQLRVVFTIKQEPSKSTGIEFLRMAITFVIAGTAWFFPQTLATSTWAWSIGSMCALILCILIGLKEFVFLKNVKAKIASTEITLLYKYATQVFLTSVIMIAIWGIDVQILAHYTNYTTVALYVNAFSIANIIHLVINPIVWVLFPLTTKLITQKNTTALRNTTDIIYKTALFVGIPGIVLATMFSGEILTVLFGATYASASTALKILVIGMFMYTLSMINLTILAGMGLVKKRNIILISTAAVNLIANLIIVKQYGLNGVATVTMISYALLLITTFILVKKAIKTESEWKYGLKLVLAAVLSALVVYLLKKIITTNIILEAIIVGSCCVAIYLAITHWLKLFGIKEIVKNIFT